MKNVKFETSLKRLETIVEEMEKSELDIDKAMKLFEEGISLVGDCTAKLNETKKKIEILVEKNAKMERIDFNGENDNENE